MLCVFLDGRNYCTFSPFGSNQSMWTLAQLAQKVLLNVSVFWKEGQMAQIDNMTNLVCLFLSDMQIKWCAFTFIFQARNKKLCLHDLEKWWKRSNAYKVQNPAQHDSAPWQKHNATNMSSNEQSTVTQTRTNRWKQAQTHCDPTSLLNNIQTMQQLKKA